MKYKVIWANRALKDLEIISDYYTKISIKTSNKIINGILKRTRQLESFPESGQIYESLQAVKFIYRRIIENNYLIIYRIEKNIIHIIAIFDSRQEPAKIRLD